jgi:Flp pilus assembly pilin Flp
VVGLAVVMEGTFVCTGPPLGNVGSIAVGVFGAVIDGKLGVIKKGFWELFGATLVSGRVVVGLSVVMVGTFSNAGATLEGFFGVGSDGAIGAVADGKFGGFSKGICVATTVGLFVASLVSGRAVVGLSVTMVGTFSSIGDPMEGAFGVIDGFFGAPIDGFSL